MLVYALCASGARIQSMNPTYSSAGVPYERYERQNAFSDHGAEEITAHHGETTGNTVLQCIDQCDGNSECDCVTFEPENGGCWLRKACNSQYFQDRDKYDVYEKPQGGTTSSKGVYYTEHQNKNAFSDHGAEEITAHHGETTGNTVLQCIDECDGNSECNCVTFEPENGGCWLRKACNAQYFQDRGKYNVYTK